MNNIVKFNNHNIELIRYNGQDYMTLSQIASALEYNNSSSINDILSRNQSEFDEEMTCLIKHGRTRQRIFNREGAWLIGMFARTPKAAEFRKWVLKVLGAVSDGQLQPAPVDMKAIGGVVKKCVAVAVRDELKAVIHDEFQYFVMRTFAAAKDLKPFQEVTDDMLLRGLYDWYSTKHHEHIKAIKDLTAENDRLKSKMAEIRKTAAE